MSREANPTTIGAFVLGAIALVAVGVLFLGSGTFFKETNHFTLFFDGSVNGLSVGAPVKFRGVTIGRVQGVYAVMDVPTEEIQIQVQIETDVSAFRTVSGISNAQEDVPVSNLVRDRGMRAKLKSQSFLTGQLYVDFDFYPGTPITLVDFHTPYPELPTLPSDMERFQRAADQLANRVKDIPLERIADSLISTLEGIDKVVNSEDLASAIEELRGTLAETKRLAEDLNRRSGPLLDSTQETLDQVAVTLENFDARFGPLAADAQATLRRADRSLSTFEPDSALSVELNRTLAELRKAAQSIRRLADTLDQNPNSLVFGRPAGEQ